MNCGIFNSLGSVMGINHHSEELLATSFARLFDGIVCHVAGSSVVSSPSLFRNRKRAIYHLNVVNTRLYTQESAIRHPKWSIDCAYEDLYSLQKSLLAYCNSPPDAVAFCVKYQETIKSCHFPRKSLFHSDTNVLDNKGLCGELDHYLTMLIESCQVLFNLAHSKMHLDAMQHITKCLVDFFCPSKRMCLLEDFKCQLSSSTEESIHSHLACVKKV